MEIKDFEVSRKINLLSKKIQDYDKFQTVAKYCTIQKHLHWIVYHSTLALEDWNKFYFEGRIMVNETKACINLLDDCKTKYSRFFEVGMFFNPPEKGF